MKYREFEALTKVFVGPLRISHFSSNIKDRTLLYGYNLGGIIYHTYILNEKIYHYVYSDEKQIILTDKIFNLTLLLPEKRLYPECCDLEFCEFLKSMGEDLLFTPFNRLRKAEQFYGEVREHTNV